jgi:uncharacterized membrane protein (UPF0127 family)
LRETIYLSALLLMAILVWAILVWRNGYSDNAAMDGKKMEIRVGVATYTVEVVATPASRNRGLMWRDHLESGHGMLFVFDTEGDHCFWMKNTRIPLSIAFIDRNGTIVRLDDMVPMSETPHCPGTDVMYALEVPMGDFLRKTVKVGDIVNWIPRHW